MPAGPGSRLFVRRRIPRDAPGFGRRRVEGGATIRVRIAGAGGYLDGALGDGGRPGFSRESLERETSWPESIGACAKAAPKRAEAATPRLASWCAHRGSRVPGLWRVVVPGAVSRPSAARQIGSVCAVTPAKSPARHACCAEAWRAGRDRGELVASGAVPRAGPVSERGVEYWQRLPPRVLCHGRVVVVRRRKRVEVLLRRSRFGRAGAVVHAGW